MLFYEGIMSNGKNLKDAKKNQKSAFDELGFKNTCDLQIQTIQRLYLADAIPWVVGYSGGKDSTAVVQLVWLSICDLKKKDKQLKPVHIISTDTLVENPIVASWVSKSLQSMEEAVNKEELPITTHRLTPKLNDSFWVNLIGRGYPAPRYKFRWCTDRLKIDPTNEFIREVVRKNGEAIIVLGVRKAESAVRARAINRHKIDSPRDLLSRHPILPNSLIYSPIENWSNDDVWLFLMQTPNPWNYNNKDLLTLYSGATSGGECPLVVDTSTPSCGTSRFGCWVCTLVDKDRSMAAMIQNDEEKEWMLPLLEFRNELDIQDDRHLRDFRRMRGHVQIYKGRPVPGPYKQSVRENFLGKLLEIQKWIRINGPDSVRNLELLSAPELNEIRRIWVVDKHEIEDTLPSIYEQQVGEPFPDQRLDDNLLFGANEMHLLKSVCKDNDLQYELIRELLDIELGYRSMDRRSGLYENLEKAFRRNFYSGVDDAADRAHRLQKAMNKAKDHEYEQLSLLSDDKNLS
jgi:DNA sulfur modification protein DndC